MNVDVLVVGSVNQDRRASVRTLARPGETVLADGTRVSGGGKGANQAAAAARAGAAVAMVGAVGDDDAGRALRAELERAGVDVGELKTVVGVPTGTAFITVADDGENTIVVDSGANAYACLELDDAVHPAVVLAQLEIPDGTVADAAAFAAAAGARFVLNAAPAPERPERIPAGADPLVVNRHEAARLLGGEEPDPEAAAARLLTTVGAASAVVTLGADGGAVATPNETYRVSAAEAARLVDTTGAGDTFTGALAAALAHGAPLREAVEAAAVSAAEAVGWPGARPSTDPSEAQGSDS